MMFAYPIGPEKQVRLKITIYGHRIKLARLLQVPLPGSRGCRGARPT